MTRRSLVSLLGAALLLPWKGALARAISQGVTLLTAPLELGGSWGGSVATDAAAVIECMRAACLTGVALLSDRQPKKLRVDDRSGSYPAIWLHTDAPTTGWITVIVGTRDWCNLAYQFGHELGHVLCNSWGPDAGPRNPCQWIEESLVEAFSLRGLGLLADDWAHAPPFPNDAAYGASIRSYRETILAGYRTAARDQGVPSGFGAWFKMHEAFLKEHGGVDAVSGAVSTMLGLLEGGTAMIADMGALNRWPGRSGVPLPDYFDLWEKSCAELHAPGLLPVRLRELLAGT
ncbi:MAG: hypothetical protein ABSA62_12945 [Methyloceanibacter sp.]|jgi:hypothetical protein